MFQKARFAKPGLEPFSWSRDFRGPKGPRFHPEHCRTFLKQAPVIVGGFPELSKLNASAPLCLCGVLVFHLSFGQHSQIVSRHFLGLRDTENPEHGRRNVLQRAIGTQGEAARISLELPRRDCMLRHHDERHGIRGMRRLRTARSGIDHLLGVAVVGGNDHGAATLPERRVNLAQAAVNSFDGGDGRRNLAGVSHHVGIGKVHHHHVEGVIRDGFDYRIGHSLRRHFRLQIVGRDFRRLYHHAVLAGKRLLDAAVEEIGHVGVLLGLGYAQIAQVAVGHHVRQDVGQRFGRRDDRQGKVFVVARHADVGQVFGNAVARDDAVEIFPAFEFAAVLRREVAVARQAAGDLPRAIGAKIKVDADIAVANRRPPVRRDCR